MKVPAADTGALELRSSWGAIRVTCAAGLVTSCCLPRLRSRPRASFCLKGESFKAPDAATRRVLRRAAEFVRGALAGRAIEPPPFRTPDASAFTAAVWCEIASIPRGCVATYGELARRVGRPRSARAVGRACGANALPLFIPCHRVVAGGGRLGGFSGGLPWKEHLLDRERARGRRALSSAGGAV